MTLKRLALLVSLALLIAAPATARQEPPAQKAGVAIMWEGREVGRVYGPLGPYSAEERARLGFSAQPRK